MGTSLRLPSELRQFLDLPGPQSLIIRGHPGTGKSTLSLALLESFSGQKLLVTNRVSRDELFRSFPWLGHDATAAIEIVDTSVAIGALDASSRTAAQLHRLVHSPGGLDRELEEFLWLPTALQEAWSRLSEAQRSILVVDSWDALVEEYIGSGLLGRSDDDLLPPREEIERLLLRRMSRSPVHLVLVLERPEETQLDYLVNGAVVTMREVHEDRLERLLSLPKLRGVRVAQGAYPFTVEGARFECIEPPRAYGQMRQGPSTPEHEPMPGFLWPGSDDFADAFGRLPLGRITLIERSSEVPHVVPRLIANAMIAQTLVRGGRCAIWPQIDQTIPGLWSEMQGVVSRKDFLSHLRVIDVSLRARSTPETNPEEFDEVQIPLPTAPWSDPVAGPLGGAALSSFLMEEASEDHPGLGVLYTTGLEAFLQRVGVPENFRGTGSYPASVEALVHERPLHLVVIGKSDSAIVAAVRDMAAVHLRLLRRLGRILLQGINPWTPSFVLTEGSERTPYSLLRVV